MRKIVTILPGGGTGAADVLRLDHDHRTRRRMVFTTDAGQAVLLDMPRTVRLRDGDGLVLDDGSTVRVEAAPEALTEIVADDLPALVRIAWHLGNRHLPTQLLGDRLRIRHDHVIADMVTGLGGRCAAIMAPFDPEGGAYAQDHRAPEQGHAQHRGHDHAHPHEHHHGGHGHG